MIEKDPRSSRVADRRPRRHFPAREHDVSGQLIAEIKRWKSNKFKPPTLMEIAPDVERDLLRELNIVRLNAGDAGSPNVERLEKFAGVDVVVDPMRAPRGVVLV